MFLYDKKTKIISVFLTVLLCGVFFVIPVFADSPITDTVSFRLYDIYNSSSPDNYNIYSVSAGTITDNTVIISGLPDICWMPQQSEVPCRQEFPAVPGYPRMDGCSHTCARCNMGQNAPSSLQPYLLS